MPIHTGSQKTMVLLIRIMMKHYLPHAESVTKFIHLLLLFLLPPSIQIAVAQQLLFPDEFKRPPGSDPGAPVTANVLPNSGGTIFYGQIGSQNVVWINDEPEILDFPGRILETNADFSYVKGVITENESYYVFKDGEYTYIDVNYPSNFSNLIVVYFSEVNNMIIGWARKIIPGVNARD
jgi:hypothetical protein